MKGLFLAAAVALLATPAAASAAVVPVTSLSGDFAATKPSVTKTPDGVHFGPYADANDGGSLVYSGANGMRLNQITTLRYSVIHDSSDDNRISAPYLRIFLEGAHDVIFDPTRCATVVPPENTLNRFNVVGDEVRYDDDQCVSGASRQSWPAVLAAHGDEVISGISVTMGFAGGTNLTALQTDLTVNGDTFCFTCAEPPTTGAGTLGPDRPVNTTTIIRQPFAVPVTARPLGTVAAAKRTCRGDNLRKIHARRRRGERFLRVSATLRGRRLEVRGRTITVDLRERAEGTYNVRITARYRTKHRKIRRVRATRTLSVACS
jgi:hypothetical protein